MNYQKITIQPVKRFDIDAAIIFSDILMVPYGLGQNVKIQKGTWSFAGKNESKENNGD